MIRGHGFVKMALSDQSVAEINVINQVRGIHRDRLANQVRGALVAAHLMGEESQQVKSVGVFRLRRQDPPVDLFRFGQSSGVMVLKGQLKSLCERHKPVSPSSYGSDECR